MLLIAPLTFASALPGNGAAVHAANALWHVQAVAYGVLFPVLLLHALVQHTSCAGSPRNRRRWLAAYLVVLGTLAILIDSFGELLEWRHLGSMQIARTGAALIVELAAAAGVVLVYRRIPRRLMSVHWLAVTVLGFLLCGILVSATGMVPGIQGDVVVFLRQLKSLLLFCLVAVTCLYVFMQPDEDTDGWHFRSRLASSASLMLTTVYCFAVAGTAAIVHSLEPRIVGVDAVMFASIFLAAVVFSPVLRWTHEMVDRQMFARWSEIEAQAHAFVDRIGADLELERIANRISNELPRVLGVESARLVVSRELLSRFQPRSACALACQLQNSLALQTSAVRGDYDLLSVPVCNPNGEALGVLLVGPRVDGQALEPPDYRVLQTLARGIAVALRNAEAHLRLQRVQLELSESERVASLGELAGGLAHEIKNPLAGLQMGLYLLEHEQGDSSKLQRIRRDAQRIDNLVSSLLRYTHNDSPEAAIRLDFRSVTASCVADVREYATDRGVTIVEEYPPRATVLLGGTTQLRLVVSNIVINAIDSAPEGGVVAVTLFIVGPLVELSVADNGPGIPPELHERVFQLNFSTKPGGSGFGLAVARREVERLGGHIAIVAPGSGGTLLRVTLPRAM